MRVAVHRIAVAVIVGHGLVHLLGAAKGLGWADVSSLTQPISTAAGLAWLAAGLLVIASGVLLALSVRWWWVVGAVAVVASQALVVTAWSDAAAGTLANVVLLLAVVYGFASQGPASYRAEYRRRSEAALAEPVPSSIVTEADLAQLPEPVAAYVRRSGAVGQPRVGNLRAQISGRIRGGPTEPWMSFTGEQVNTFGAEPQRLFFIDATMRGLPIDVLHVFVGRSATMRVRIASIIPMVDAAGTEMDHGETVTVFNDLCVLAPAALIDAPIEWHALDRHHVRGAFTRGAHTVTAVLELNDDGELVDFTSDDRSAASADGKQFTRQRWSTPLTGYRSFGAARIASSGEGRWHAPPPEGEFTYIDFHVDEITYNAGAGAHDRPAAVRTLAPR